MSSPARASRFRLPHAVLTEPDAAGPARLLTTAVAALVAATVLVQTGNFFTSWNRDIANWLLISTAFTLVGGAIASRLPRNAFGWTLLAIGAGGAVAASTATLPGPWVVTWTAYWSWLIPLTLLPCALLVFPTGRLPSHRWRPILALAVGAAVLAPLLLAIASAVAEDPLKDGTAPTWVLASRVSAVLAAVALLFAIASLLVRVRGASGVERRQVLSLLLGGVATLFAVVLDSVCLPGAWVIGALAIPASAAVAILWYQLYDLDMMLNRSLVYSGLTVCLVGAYGVCVWLGNLLLQNTVPTAAIPVIAAPAVAVGLDPLRRRLQRSVDRLLYGNRRDPYAVMTAVGRRFDAPAPADARAALVEVAATIAENLALPYVAIELVSEPAAEPAGEWGRRTAATVPLKLCYRGERVGTLRVAPHTTGGGLSDLERRLLEDVARQVAVTAHVVQLSHGLQRSRQELVAAREEERRRLRRDLHDGLGPTLAAMTMRIDAARNLLKRDPAAVDSILTDLREESQRAIDEIRRVAYGLRPPALDELGLMGAIEECTEQFGATDDEAQSFDVNLDLPDGIPSLPAAVEVAVLRIVQEALANVAHHSKATVCGVRVEVDAAVAIEIEDDGDGLPADYRPGIGLHSMRERAAEVGGTCAIERRRPHGTRVLARLPLGAV